MEASNQIPIQAFYRFLMKKTKVAKNKIAVVQKTPGVMGTFPAGRWTKVFFIFL